MKEEKRKTFFKDKYTFNDLQEVVEQLRDPVDGCPWDRVQTHESMHDCLIEETFEVVEAINNNDIPNMREELGDVLLQVLLHTSIAKEQDEFSFEDVVDELAKKLVRRHPHVFGEDPNCEIEVVKADSASEGLSRWEAIKKKEKESSGVGEGKELSRIPKELPPIMRYNKILKKSEKIYGNTDGREAMDKAFENYLEALSVFTETIEEYIKNKEQ